MSASHPLPPQLAHIVAEMQRLDQKGKFERLLDYADQLPPLPAHIASHHDAMRQVDACITPIFVQAELRQGRVQFYLDVSPNTPTMRGYSSLLLSAINDQPPAVILAIPHDIHIQMGLSHVLAPQRLNEVAHVLQAMQSLTRSLVNASQT